jgi:TPR repeat protein
MKLFTAYVVFFMATFALCLPLIAQNTDYFIHLKYNAENGNADAQLKFGQAYASGIDVPKDATESVKWYTKSAEQGNAEAQFHLGEAFLNGEGVEKDAIDAYAYLNLAGITLEKARASRSGLELEMTKEQIAAGQRKSKELKERLLKKAEEERLHNEAQEERKHKIAEEERLREEAEKDNLRKVAEEESKRKEAEEESKRKEVNEKERLRKEAEEESKRKEVNEKERLHKLAEEERLREEAGKESLRKEAEQGNAEAQYVLGEWYANGKGVAKDEVEAVKWYRKAAEQGYAKAQYVLGNCYANGKGVAKDEVEAYAWYYLTGNIFGMNRLKEKFTWYQLAKGQKRTKELQSQIARSKGE